MFFGYFLLQKLLWVTVRYNNITILMDTQLLAVDAVTEKQSWGSDVFVLNVILQQSDPTLRSCILFQSWGRPPFRTASRDSSIKESVVPKPAKFIAVSAWSRSTLGRKGNFLFNEFVRSFSVLKFKAEKVKVWFTLSGIQRWSFGCSWAPEHFDLFCILFPPRSAVR